MDRWRMPTQGIEPHLGRGLLTRVRARAHPEREIQTLDQLIRALKPLLRIARTGALKPVRHATWDPRRCLSQIRQRSRADRDQHVGESKRLAAAT